MKCSYARARSTRPVAEAFRPRTGQLSETWDCVVGVSGVGENLRITLEFYSRWPAKVSISLYSSMSPFAKALIGARWLLRNASTCRISMSSVPCSRSGFDRPAVPRHPTHERRL